MNEILIEGTSVMLIGMGTVFMFLCIMIVAMNIMSAVVAKLNTIFPEPVEQTAGGGKVRKASSNDEEVAAAIVAAMFAK